MKVVQINAVCGSGSTGRICTELSEYMTESNIENYIFYGNGCSTYAISERINSDNDVKVHGLLSRISGKQGYYSTYTTKKIIKRLADIRPNIVHLHNLHGNYTNLNVLLDYLARNDIATVITLHDCFFYTGKCTHYTMDGCYKWQTGCHDCPRLKKDNPSWFFDRTSKMWRDKKSRFEAIPRLGVIGVSDWVTNEARKSFLKNAAIIKRIYNWIDLDVFYPRGEDVREKYNIPKNKFIILTVGGGWNEKSDKFKDILKISEMIDGTMHIVMVGGGLNRAKLPDNITHIDYINGTDELAKIYSCADVYVHVSREDTFGKVVAEAMACGTPSIVYDSTGLPELIGDGCGYAVSCEDVGAMYEKINVIYKNGKKIYSDKCVSFVSENFEKKELLEDTLEVYKELIGMGDLHGSISD